MAEQTAAASVAPPGTTKIDRFFDGAGRIARELGKGAGVTAAVLNPEGPPTLGAALDAGVAVGRRVYGWAERSYPKAISEGTKLYGFNWPGLIIFAITLATFLEGWVKWLPLAVFWLIGIVWQANFTIRYARNLFTWGFVAKALASFGTPKLGWAELRRIPYASGQAGVETFQRVVTGMTNAEGWRAVIVMYACLGYFSEMPRGVLILPLVATVYLSLTNNASGWNNRDVTGGVVFAEEKTKSRVVQRTVGQPEVVTESTTKKVQKPAMQVWIGWIMTFLIIYPLVASMWVHHQHHPQEELPIIGGIFNLITPAVETPGTPPPSTAVAKPGTAAEHSTAVPPAAPSRGRPTPHAWHYGLYHMLNYDMVVGGRNSWVIPLMIWAFSLAMIALAFIVGFHMGWRGIFFVPILWGVVCAIHMIWWLGLAVVLIAFFVGVSKRPRAGPAHAH